MSSPYVDVPFELRVPPAVGVGGMFATGNGDKKPVTTERLGRITDQLWQAASPINGNKDDNTVIIFNKESGLTWNFTKPGQPVTLSSTDKPSLWYIQNVAENGTEYIKIIANTGDLVGATWYAGVEGNTVVIKSIPVIQYPPPAPFWAFIS